MTRHFSDDERWNGASIDFAHWHFHRQLYERYGIIMGPGDFSDMVKRGLRKGKALLLRETAQGGKLYRWRVKSTGERIFIIADRERVITAYPPRKSLKKLADEMEAQRKQARAAAQPLEIEMAASD